MPQSKNMGRLSEDMKREVISIIQEMKDPRVQGFLTVMRLEVTQDLAMCKVYVSMLSKEKTTEEAVKALNKASGHVRSEIAKRMHIRKAPEMRFIADAGTEYAGHINDVIAQLNKKDG